MLASVQIIQDVKKHPNADALDIVEVLGWVVVTKSGEFKPGDACVYVALDSILPERTEFEFMRKSNFRVRTIKLRGQLSQGICFPLSILSGDRYIKGQDVTEELGVTKYEKPIPQSQDAKGSFPTELVSKTDEERLQNIPDVMDFLKGRALYISKKHDGTSFTFTKQDDDIKVCSRNLELKEGNNHHWNIAKQFKLFDIPGNFIIQGELVGPGIQGNREGLKEVTLKVFNVYRHGQLLGYDKMREFCVSYNLPMVDLVYIGYNNYYHTVDDFLQLADLTKYDNGSQAEGIVVRLADNIFCSAVGKDLSFKVISNKYALKHGE